MPKPDLQEEKKLWKKNYLVVGLDEVGRGAFAGPVVVGAVCFDETIIDSVETPLIAPLQDIDDSKRLKPKKRKILAKEIKKHALAWAISEVGVSTINKIGIGRATEKAMRLAVKCVLSGLPNWSNLPNLTKPFLLVDAFQIKYLRGIGLKNQKGIIKGDRKSVSIAAASIIAKVHRDNLMRKLSRKYKKYGWGKNKGYGTKKHREAIKKHGATKLHRRAFVSSLLGKY